MMSVCLNCGKELISEGTKPKKYCSDACRKVYKRTNGQAANGQNKKRTEQTDKSNKSDNNTPNSEVTGVMIETPEGKKLSSQLPDNYGQEGCSCRHCEAIKNKPSIILNHGAFKPLWALQSGQGMTELNRVSLPGDNDYNGVAKECAA